jgi:hypothetical protein
MKEMNVSNLGNSPTMAKRTFVVIGPDGKYHHADTIEQVCHIAGVDPDSEGGLEIESILSSYDYLEVGDYSVELENNLGGREDLDDED